MTVSGGQKSESPSHKVAAETHSWSQLPIRMPAISFFGAIKWIQRLEKDPGTW